MDHTEQDGMRVLEALREAAPTAQHEVSVAAAMRAGRRRVFTRRAFAGAGVVAVTAMVLAGSMVIAGGRNIEPAAPANGEFDVQRQAFTVGKAAGFRPVTYETGRYRQRIQLRPENSQYSLADAKMPTVTLYAKGRQPEWLRSKGQIAPPRRSDQPAPSGSNPEPGGREAPKVNGRKAFYQDYIGASGPSQTPVTTPGGRRRGDHDSSPAIGLAWEWAEGAWGIASFPSAVNENDKELESKLHKIAQSVESGKDVPVTVPFRLTKPVSLPGLRLVGVINSVGAPNGQHLAALAFGDQDLKPVDNGDYSSGAVWVGVQQGLTGTEEVRFYNNAWLQSSAGGGHLTDQEVRLRRGAGFAAVAELSRSDLLDKNLVPQLADLANSVELVANPTDPKSWIGNPLG